MQDIVTLFSSMGVPAALFAIGVIFLLPLFGFRKFFGFEVPPERRFHSAAVGTLLLVATCLWLLLSFTRSWAVAGVWQLSNRTSTVVQTATQLSFEPTAAVVGFGDPPQLLAPHDGVYRVDMILMLDKGSSGYGGIELQADNVPFAANWVNLGEGTISVSGMALLKKGAAIAVKLNPSQGEMRLDRRKGIYPSHLSYLAVSSAAPKTE